MPTSAFQGVVTISRDGGSFTLVQVPGTGVDFPTRGQTRIYDTADNLLVTTTVTGSAAGTFFGWESPGGIGKVYINNTPNTDYVQFDNLGFGAAPVPIPAAVWLFGSALAGMGIIGRRKSQSELAA